MKHDEKAIKHPEEAKQELQVLLGVRQREGVGRRF
jgi:hypothetical protein